MTEAELDREVRRLIRGLGLLAYHPYDSRRSAPGWPDWVIVGARIIFRELKQQQARPTPEQRAWGRAITAAGGDWAVWKPADYYSGRIAAELAALSTPGQSGVISIAP